jgi:hypothetical protein
MTTKKGVMPPKSKTGEKVYNSDSGGAETTAGNASDPNLYSPLGKTKAIDTRSPILSSRA